MSKRDLFKVTAIGTCRIVNALSEEQREPQYALNNSKVYGFVHCTKDIIQQIRFMRGELQLPQELIPLICNSSRRVDPNQVHPESQLYLVEISSLKEVAYGQYYLQLNHLNQHFSDRRELLQILFKNGPVERLPNRAAMLGAHPDYHRCSDLERDILRTAVVTNQGYDDLIEDIRKILSMFSRPPVFVAHCDVLLQGKPIPSRQRLIGYLREASALLGFELFEPTPLIHQYGQAFAMAKEGEDTAHYSPEFESVLARELCARYIAPRLAHQAGAGRE